MVNRLKKSIVWSALFLLLSQVLAMTLCNVTAVAVTEDQNKISLFDNEYGKASISYEVTENERLKWNVHLEKNNQTKTATRLSLDLVGDGQPVIPEQVQTTNQANTTLSFSNKLDDGQIAPKVLEGSAGSDTGTIDFSFETGANYQSMVVKPVLEKVGETGSNVLSEQESQGKSFDLTQVQPETVSSESTVATEASTDAEETAVTSTETSEEATITTDSTVNSSSSEEQTSTTTSTDATATEESDATADSIPIEAFATAGNVTLAGSLPTGNELVINQDADNDQVKVTSTDSTNQIISKKSINGTGNYSYDPRTKIDNYKDIVYSHYTNSKGKVVNGATVVYLPQDKSKLNKVVITAQYNYVGTFKGEKVGAKLTIKNIIKADTTSYTHMPTPVIDFATSLYSGMVYDNIVGMDITFQFTDSSGKPLSLNPDTSFLTFASLNNVEDNAGWGSEFVFPGYATSAYLTEGTALEKGIPEKGNKSSYPYKNDAFFGKRHFGDHLEDPDYVNGAVSFNLNDNNQGSTFTIGSLASRAWTSFMSSVLVPIDPGAPTKRVTEFTGWDNRNEDELDILIDGQENVVLNGKTTHSYFINQPLYDVDQSIARPTSIQLTDKLPKYVKPTSVKLLQSDGQIADLSYRLSGIQPDSDGQYSLDISLTADEMKAVKFDGQDLTWQIDVELVGAEDVANETKETIFMNNVANVAFIDGQDELFNHNTNHVETQVTPELLTIHLEKKWLGDDGYENLRQPVTLQLQRSFDAENWDNPEVIQEFQVTNDTLAFDYEVPAKVDQKLAYYRIVEVIDGNATQVPGYKTPVYSDPRVISANNDDKNLVVTNELLVTKLDFTKVSNDGKTPLADVIFTLEGDNGYQKEITTGADGQVNFEGLPIGKYTLKEKSVPVGYEQKGPWEFEVVQNGDELSIDWTSENPFANEGILVNELKPFDLIVNKTTETGKALEGAQFTLTDANGTTFPSTIAGSIFTFTGLKPGTYTLEETKAPDGYRLLNKPIEIVIDELGNVTVAREVQDNVLVSGEKHNQIEIDVKNDPKAPLPSTGGPGTLLFTLIGVLAVTAAGVYLFLRKDREVA
ncbi:SpaA isopeptide-forming pilin-related protein [Enterococcus asini]|uniref:SpaA isopeptide-forming pilin-related protein n=1 Tax=Enterococcus asini TaxID=57732 RepID=UPI00288D6561|nr:SpaA isopeptide-forming pilin-related protein [Enterococcus asini]MDT2756307.1 SpaA isopeptide-forming pilin-related protein [Enterococcus asini]